MRGLGLGGGKESGSGTAEPFGFAGGGLEVVDGVDGAGEHGDRNHLGDFVAAFDFNGSFAEVGHDDLDFAAVSGVDDSGGGGDAARAEGGAIADEEAQGDAGFGVARLDGDAGADADGV